MFEVHAGATGLGGEPHFDLGDEVGIVSKFRRELPDEDQSGGRLPGDHLAELAFRSVDIELVPAAAFARLDDRTVEVGGADLMGLGPPAADTAGENFECMLLRCADEDTFTHWRRADLRTHLF